MKQLIFQERKILDSMSTPGLQQEPAVEAQNGALLAAYLRTKPQVDAAVAAFAETLEWPELTPLEKTFVRARLDFAWEILSILNTSRDGEPLISYPSPEKSSTAELIEWLLIDIWPYGCGRFLQTHKMAAEQAQLEQANSGVSGPSA
jgi:hypothetical protein